MAKHATVVTIDAPIDQVYTLFTHFNDFPKFMHFVEEVTYYDAQRSHWVANIAGRHEWDAVNEDWIDERQIGWRSTDGLENTGKVAFQALGPARTQVEVTITYNPPASFLGDAAEKLGMGKRFEQALRRDLDNFARMVSQAPAGALDPLSSSYLFHNDGVAAGDATTPKQNATMDAPL